MSGHTTEKLLLGVILPVVHTAVWNIVLALVRACGSHLLPYAAHIESNLVMGMSDTSHDLKRSAHVQELTVCATDSLLIFSLA